MRYLYQALLFSVLFTFPKVEAHFVEQFYADFKEDRELVLVNFDVAYAIPEVREVENAPQPLREWLVSRSDEEHTVLRKEAKKYLRSYLSFESNGKEISYDIRFPDFKTSPYNFPKLLNAGAYYNVELIPEQQHSGSVSIKIHAGEFPKLVIARIGKEDAESAFNIIESSESYTLFDSSVGSPTIGGDGLLAEENESRFAVIDLFILGFRHVIPDGLDHILFIFGMCLMAGGLRQLLWLSIIFTSAHSLSMALVVSQMFPVYSFGVSGYIEAVIALSIAFIAIESYIMKAKMVWRYSSVAMFGFVHGLGFAGSLGSTLQFLSDDAWLFPLLVANIGIECAQVVLVVMSFSFLVYLRKNYSEKVDRLFRMIVTFVIAGIAVYWFVERLPLFT